MRVNVSNCAMGRIPPAILGDDLRGLPAAGPLLGRPRTRFLVPSPHVPGPLAGPEQQVPPERPKLMDGPAHVSIPGTRNVAGARVDFCGRAGLKSR